MINIKQEDLDKFAGVGITQDNIKAFIDEGRENGLDDESISASLRNNYKRLETESTPSAPFKPTPEAVRQVRERTEQFADKHDTILDSQFIRAPVAAMQGAHESYLNPIGLADRAQNFVRGNGFETSEALKPVIPETAAERAAYLAGNYMMGVPVANQAMGGIKAAGLLGQGITKTSKVANALLAPAAMPIELAGAAGAGALTGAVDPQTWYGKLATGVVGGIGGAGAANAINSVGVAGIGKNFIGRSEFKSALKDSAKLAKSDGSLGSKIKNFGRTVGDVDFGKLSKDRMQEIDNLPLSEIANLQNGRVVIPADRINHIARGRIIEQGRTPKEVADVTQNLFHGKNTKVAADNPYAVLLANSIEPPTGYGILLPNKNQAGTDVVETIIKARPGDVASRLERARLRLSQPTGNNITPIPDNVNTEFVKSFANRDSARTMRNAVMSGEEDIMHNARALGDRMTRLEAGAPDKNLYEALMTPELKAANAEYGAFMDSNSGMPIPLQDFYKANPIAKPLLDSARKTNPQGFQDIVPGSFEEAEQLKRLLKSAGSRVGESTPKSEAYSTARGQLKDLMDEVVPGFKALNMRYADSKMTQKLFEDGVKRGVSSVGGATVSPFWSGISGPLAGAGAIGGVFNPSAWLATTGGLGGKAALRANRRAAGRAAAKGIEYAPLFNALQSTAKATPAGTLPSMLLNEAYGDENTQSNAIIRAVIAGAQGQ